MPVVVTYDVARNHTQVKDALKKLGYVDSIAAVSTSDQTTKGIIYFPNTTLYHTTKNSTTAHSDIVAVAKSNTATLEKCIAFDLPVSVSFTGSMTS